MFIRNLFIYGGNGFERSLFLTFAPMLPEMLFFFHRNAHSFLSYFSFIFFKSNVAMCVCMIVSTLFLNLKTQSINDKIIKSACSTPYCSIIIGHWIWLVVSVFSLLFLCYIPYTNINASAWIRKKFQFLLHFITTHIGMILLHIIIGCLVQTHILHTNKNVLVFLQSEKRGNTRQSESFY